jgi:hypothetical protein
LAKSPVAAALPKGRKTKIAVPQPAACCQLHARTSPWRHSISTAVGILAMLIGRLPAGLRRNVAGEVVKSKFRGSSTAS